MRSSCARWSRISEPVHPRARGEHFLSGFMLNSPHRPVHPRARGEHKEIAHASTGPVICGSSPRSRGTCLRTVQKPSWGRLRFIPALAGNIQYSKASMRPHPAVHPRARGEHSTTWINRHRTRTTVHPRARGEHPLPCSRIRPNSDLPGSSPRSRGTLITTVIPRAA